MEIYEQRWSNTKSIHFKVSSGGKKDHRLALPRGPTKRHHYVRYQLHLGPCQHRFKFDSPLCTV